MYWRRGCRTNGMYGYLGDIVFGEAKVCRLVDVDGTNERMAEPAETEIRGAERFLKHA